MPLEATMLLLDNSDWTRNGDYYPSRWETQINAATLIIEDRCSSNPENSLGIITMAGKRVEVNCTLTNDESTLSHSMDKIRLNGECDFTTSLRIAMLCLKHRSNTSQKERIILFIGSPIKNTIKEIQIVGRFLRKNNVAMDIISFGHVDANREILNELLNSVKNENNSSIIEVPVGGFIMDSLLTSSVLGGGNQGNEFDMIGMDNNNNNNNQNINQQGIGMSDFEREMNLAMQLSLEEMKKQEEKNKKEKEEKKEDNEKKNDTGITPTPGNDKVDEEDDELKQAMLLSIQEGEKNKKKEKEKQIEKDALRSPDFIMSIMNAIDAHASVNDVNEIVDKLNNPEKKDDKKDEKKDDKKNDKDDNKEDQKEEKKDDKMDVEKDKKK